MAPTAIQISDISAFAFIWMFRLLFHFFFFSPQKEMFKNTARIVQITERSSITEDSSRKAAGSCSLSTRHMAAYVCRDCKTPPSDYVNVCVTASRPETETKRKTSWRSYKLKWGAREEKNKKKREKERTLKSKNCKKCVCSSVDVRDQGTNTTIKERSPPPFFFLCICFSVLY